MSVTSAFATTYDPSNPSAALPAYPTAAEILLSTQQALEKQNGLLTNYNAGGVTETYLEAVSIVLGSDSSSLPGVTIEGAYELLFDVAQSAFAVTAQNAALDLKGADVAVLRKLEDTATVQLQFSVAQPAPAGGIAVPAGTICQAENSDPTQSPVLYSTNATASILQGATTAASTVSATCLVAGSNGNQIAGAINTCISNSSLIVTNPGGATGGLDRELDDDATGGYRQRVLDAIPNASQCTVAAIEEDALQYPVTSSVLVENTADDGVTQQYGRGQLYIDDGSGNLGDPSNTNYASFVALQNAFDTGLYRAAGTQIHVRGSQSIAIAIVMEIVANEGAILQGATQSQIAAAVQTALYTFVNSLGMGNPISIASLIAQAKNVKLFTSNVPAVSNVIVSSVTVNGANADFTPLVYQLPRVLPNIAAVAISVVGVSPYS